MTSRSSRAKQVQTQIRREQAGLGRLGLSDPANYTHEGIRRICLNILVQTIRDASCDDQLLADIRREARDWLRTYGAQWAQGLGLPLMRKDFDAWAAAGFPAADGRGKADRMDGNEALQIRDYSKSHFESEGEGGGQKLQLFVHDL